MTDEAAVSYEADETPYWLSVTDVTDETAVTNKAAVTYEADAASYS